MMKFGALMFSVEFIVSVIPELEPRTHITWLEAISSDWLPAYTYIGMLNFSHFHVAN